MDEKMIRAINEAAKQLGDALSAAYEPIKEWANEVATSLIETFNAVLEAMQPALDIAELHRKAQRDIEKRQKERSKWRTAKDQTIRPLLLDKRSKVHRCRNAI